MYTKDIIEEKALQEFLRDYYRKIRLKIPNPVVSEELQLDCLYVNPDINILRETKNSDLGLVNVSDQPTSDEVSQCRQLFYTLDYKCRQIYITGDAGIGKSMYCKHLVDLWCKSDDEMMTNASHTSDNSDYEYGPFEWMKDDTYRSWDSNSDIQHSASGHSGTSNFSYGNIGRAHEEDMKRKEDMKIEEDRKIMSEFILLFYVILRESPNQYNVADIIDSQILQHNQETQHPKARVLLQKVPCLVIIDGLDEWVRPLDSKVPPFVNPGIPGRDWLNKNNVFLTTTRSWKFDVLQLKSSELDKNVELVGFNSNSSVKLCSKIIKLLNHAERVQRFEGEFQTELRKNGLTHLCNIPVILTQLICLWFDNQDLGQSQVQLYCGMTELLLKRAVKNLPEQTCTLTQENAHKTIHLPECFSDHKHCQYYQRLLVSLCKVAFKALFNHKREHALVFESSQIEICGVDQNDIDLCLKSGILSQTKVLGKWSICEKKLSFLHKKVQEFISAIFITNCENTESIMAGVKHFCTTVETTLDMSQVWVFVSGLRPDLARQLLTDLMNNVVLKDTGVHEYRHTLSDVYTGSFAAQSIQNCILDCVVEARSNGHLDFCLPLEDFVIYSHTISKCLESLLTSNKAAVKSASIRTFNMAGETAERILSQIRDTRYLQKLYLNDRNNVITKDDYLHLILDNNNHNLTCLALKYITLTADSTCAAVCGSFNHVTTLDMYYVKLTHTQIEQVVSSVSQSHIMKELQLWWLNCTDHGGYCRPGIDLSAHTQLHTLYLGYMYVKNLPDVAHRIQYIKLWHATIKERQLRRFINKLPSISLKLTVELCTVTVTDDNKSGDVVTFYDVNLTDLIYNAKFVVTQCLFNECTWHIKFHTLQQQETTESNTNMYTGTVKSEQNENKPRIITHI